MSEQTRMPESTTEAWLGQSRTVAKSRPAVLRISIDKGPANAGRTVYRAWYMLGNVLRQATVAVEHGQAWEDALADSLERDYAARISGGVS